jgi:hypothetical protein
VGDVQEIWPDVDAVIKCMPMAKSVAPRESRFCAARSLPRSQDIRFVDGKIIDNAHHI